VVSEAVLSVRGFDVGSDKVGAKSESDFNGSLGGVCSFSKKKRLLVLQRVEKVQVVSHTSVFYKYNELIAAAA
jgi:hypothetical protein